MSDFFDFLWFFSAISRHGTSEDNCLSVARSCCGDLFVICFCLIVGVLSNSRAQVSSFLTFQAGFLAALDYTVKGFFHFFLCLDCQRGNWRKPGLFCEVYGKKRLQPRTSF